MIDMSLRNTNLLKFTIALLFLCLILPTPTRAQTVDLPEQALLDTLALAKSGDSAAMYEIALYLVATETYQLAFGWALNAAHKGHADAAELTGSLYRQGFGIAAPNYIKARKWLERARTRNSKEPNFELALLYADTDYPNHDMKRSAEFLARAIRRNEPRACLVAARNKLTQGKPFKQTLPQVRCAANGGLVAAMLTLAEYHLSQRSPDGIVEAKRWLRAAADAGSEAAQMQLLELPNITPNR